MAHFVITSLNRSLVVKGILNQANLNVVAEAFTNAYDEDRPLHGFLRDLYGNFTYKWYCIDMSDAIFRVTFSNADKPRVLVFQGEIAAIASVDSETLTLYAQEATIIKPGHPGRQVYPYNITNLEW